VDHVRPSRTSSPRATRARRWSTCGVPRAASGSSVSCGSRCCARRPSSASPSPTARSRPTRRSSTTSTSPRSPRASGSLRHDVKARIEEFCALAGHEVIHRGMTSRDVTENVEQLQVRRALELVRDRIVAALVLIAERAVEHRDTVVVGRSHNMPAQPTTFGKRLTNVGQELMSAYERIESLLERQPLRGLKGPVGTQADLVALLGDADKVEELEAASPSTSASSVASTRSVRSTRARSTSRSSARSCRPRAPRVVREHGAADGRRRAHHRGVRRRARSARRRCRTR
jgi:hypothetical protein